MRSSSEEAMGEALPNGATAVLEGHRWWEKNDIAATKIDIAADPVTKRTRSGKIVVVRDRHPRPWTMKLAAVILRILGLLAGAATVFVGGWMIFKVATEMTSNLTYDNSTTLARYGAMSIFLILAGFLIFLIECRTKSLMRGCFNTYIIVANYLSRGILMIIVGALMFTDVTRQFPFRPTFGSFTVEFWWIAMADLILGVANCLYFVVYFKHKRNKEVALQPKYVANAEEIAYGMNLYDPEQRKLEEEKRRKIAEAANGTSPAALAMYRATPIEYDEPTIVETPHRYSTELDSMSKKGKEPAFNDTKRSSKALPTVPGI